jgi:hypothetical protein
MIGEEERLPGGGDKSYRCLAGKGWIVYTLVTTGFEEAGMDPLLTVSLLYSAR